MNQREFAARAARFAQMARGLAVLLTIFGLAACSESQVDATQHLTLAQQHLARNDVNASIIELKNALQIDPNLAEARFLLGRVHLDVGDGAAARKELERAQALGYDVPELRYALWQSFLAVGEFDALLAQAPQVGDTDASADLLALRAEAHLALGELDKARTVLDGAAQLDPDAVPVLLGLARLNLLNGEVESARAPLTKAAGAQPDNVRVWLLTGDMESIDGDAAAAEQAYRQAVKLSSRNPLGLLGLANALVSQGKLDEATAPLDAIDRLYPKHPAANYLRAVIALRQDQKRIALDAFRSVLASAPNHPQSLLAMGQLLLGEGQLQQAEEHARRLFDRTPGFAPAAKLLAAIQLRQGKPENALRTLRTIDPDKDADGRYMALMGSAHTMLGDLATGQDFLAQASALAPQETSIKTQLALNLLAGGSATEAIAELEAIVAENPESERAEILLVLSQIRAGKYKQARDAAEAFSKKYPDSPLGHNLLGAAFVALKDQASARKSFDRALSLDANFAPAIANLSILDIAAGDRDSAQSRLEALMETDPANERAALILSSLWADAGDPDKPVALLEQVRAQNPKATQTRILLARNYLQRGPWDKSLQIAEEAFELAPQHPAVLQILSSAQSANGKSKQAVATAQALVTAAPNTALSHYVLGTAYSRNGADEDAKTSLTKALELNSEYPGALNGLAALEMRADNPEAALRYAKQGIDLDPEQAWGYVLRGDIQAASDNFAAATSAYKTALTKTESTATAVKLYALYQLQDADQAHRFATTWIDDHPDDVGMRLQLATAHQQKAENEAATMLYQEVLERQPEHGIALNNLAWLYHLAKNPEAVTLAASAYEKFPEQPEIIDTYAWILVDKGKLEQAIKLFEKALTKTDSPDIRYHYAAALAKAGEERRAIDNLNQSLTVEQFSERAQAERLLRQLSMSPPAANF